MPAVEPSVRVFFHTLGCPKNDADSRSLMRRLVAAGVVVVEDPSEATHVVVNTCGFIRDAKEESIGAILDVCEEFPGAQVLVMGCLVERYREELTAGIPEVSGWLGVAGEDVGRDLVGLVAGEAGGGSAVRRLPRTETSSYAYLKISDGCDERCTFCAIPGFKGPYVAVPTEEILREADACLSEGAVELVLVGQDTTRWTSDGLDLRGLVDELASDDRVHRIRLMYLQPARLQDDLLEFMAGHDKLCRYLDIPFQHSNPEVLRRMGRTGDGDSYLALLERARALMPCVTTRSTFIVGFPGETREHFTQLVRFVQRARFDYGGAFRYSPEEGTRAAALTPVIRPSEAQRRLNALNDVLLESGEDRRADMVGTEVEVVVDTADDDEMMEGVAAIGRTEGQAPEVDGITYLRGDATDKLATGAVVRARITEMLGCDLMGEIVAP